MISADSLIHFSPDVLVAVSSKQHGTMLDRGKESLHHPDVVDNRRAWCEEIGVSYDEVVYQQIVYATDQTYRSIVEVTANDTSAYVDGVKADALFTKEVGVGLFLPVADCIATVVYDPKRRFLATLHLGRHSTFAGLVSEAMHVFISQGTDPSDVLVWMSPSAQKESYRLEWFDHETDSRWQGFFEKKSDGYYIDMQGYNAREFGNRGVLSQHITISTIDTLRSDQYFSHRQGDKGGRIAVLAQMR